MKTVTTKIYKFKELSKASKQTAIEEFSQINIDYEWWDGTYDDAAEIGLTLTEFDIGYRREITGEFKDSAKEVAEAILVNHGDQCETYKTATKFLIKYKVISVTIKLLGDEEENDTEYMTAADKLEDLEAEFLKDILEDYLKMLQEEYDYLQSDEAIKETIEANEYDFYKDGTQYSARKLKAA